MKSQSVTSNLKSQFATSSVFDAFAVVDLDDGVYFETVADTPKEAMAAIDSSRLSGDEHDPTMARMLSGKVRVCAVRIEIGAPVDIDLGEQK